MKRFFTLEYWKDDGWFVGKLMRVPGVFSQGETLKELQENIEDAYHEMLETDAARSHPGAQLAFTYQRRSFTWLMRMASLLAPTVAR